MINRSDIPRGKPHIPHFLTPPVVLSAGCVLMTAAALLFLRGTLFSSFSAILFFAVAAIIGLWAGFRRHRLRSRSLSVEAGCVRVTLPSWERRLAVSGIVCIGLDTSRLYRLFGCVRVRLYAEGRKRAWLSALLKQEEADALVNELLRALPRNEELRGGYVSPGKYSAAICALTSERPLLMLTAAALLTVFSGGRAAMDFPADALLLWAAAEMLWNAARFRKLSITTDTYGYRVKSGFSGNRTTIVPAGSAAGVCISYSPVGALCGAGSVELLCSGGRRVPLARWMAEDVGRKAALSLLGVTENRGSFFSDADGLRRSCFTECLRCFSFSAVAAVADLTVMRTGGMILTAGIFALCCGGLRCFAGFRLAERSGIEVTSSFFRAGGVKYCGAELLYLRRNCVEGIRISSPLFSRMNNLCSVWPIVRGGNTGVRCGHLSYPAVEGMIRRFV